MKIVYSILKHIVPLLFFVIGSIAFIEFAVYSETSVVNIDKSYRIGQLIIASIAIVSLKSYLYFLIYKPIIILKKTTVAYYILVGHIITTIPSIIAGLSSVFALVNMLSINGGLAGILGLGFAFFIYKKLIPFWLKWLTNKECNDDEIHNITNLGLFIVQKKIPELSIDEETFFRIYLPALEEAIEKDYLTIDFNIIGADYYYKVDKKMHEQMDLFGHEYFEKHQSLFEKAAYYFDAKSHNFPTVVDNITIAEYRELLLKEIDTYKARYLT